MCPILPALKSVSSLDDDFIEIFRQLSKTLPIAIEVN